MASIIIHLTIDGLTNKQVEEDLTTVKQIENYLKITLPAKVSAEVVDIIDSELDDDDD